VKRGNNPLRILGQIQDRFRVVDFHAFDDATKDGADNYTNIERYGLGQTH